MAGLGYSAVVTATGVTVVMDGETHSIPADAINFKELVDAIRAKKPKDSLTNIITPESAIKHTVASMAMGLEIKLDQFSNDVAVFYDGLPLHGVVASRIEAYAKENIPFDSLKNFMTKALAGKDEKRMDALFTFIDRNKLPIHPDGDVLAFKAVRGDYKDKHSGTVLYEVGTYVEVENFDTSQHAVCSTGLHIGGREYVNSYGGHSSKLMVVKVNPADFVAYTGQEHGKTRVRKLLVYGELIGVDLKTALQTLVASLPEGDKAETKVKKSSKKSKSSGMNKGQTIITTSPVKEKKKAAEKAPVKQLKQVAAPTAKTRQKTYTSKGLTMTAKDILAATEKHGQRGFSALYGVPRTTLQGWLKDIKGNES